MTEAEYAAAVEETVGRYLDREILYDECAAELRRIFDEHRGPLAPVGEIAA